MENIANKVAVITGASSGLGAETARHLGEAGAKVALGARRLDRLEALARELGSDNATVFKVDVSEREQVQAFVDHAVATFGRIDVMINNAGVMPLAFYADHEAAADAWDRCIDINIKGVLHGIIAVHDQMIGQGRGQVVNISSVYGNAPVGGAAVYGATKAAVNVLSESLRQESLGKIKVTTVRPTGVPGTGLAGGIINVEAVNPVLGANKDQFYDKLAQVFSENPPARLTDEDSIELAALAPGQIADQVIHAINQPWGVSIADITVRASNDDYIV